MTLSNSLQQRYLGGMSAKAAFALAAGRVLLASLSTANERPIGMGSPINKQRSVEIEFIGTGADDAALNYRLYQVVRSASGVAAGLRLLGGGVATLSTAVMAAGDGLLAAGETAASVRLADTITFVTAGIEEEMSQAVGSPGIVATTPAANTPAQLLIPDLGAGDDILIEFEKGTATGVDAVYRTFV